MNKTEYDNLIRTVIARARDAGLEAAQRNQHKDEFPYYRYSDMPPAITYGKGWSNYNFTKKLREEVEEYLKLGTFEEAGDIIWVVAMMIDQHSEGLRESKGKRE